MKKHFTRICRLPALPATKYWRRFSAFLFITWSLSLVASAQNKVWDKTIGGNDHDGLNTLQQTSDGGYILAGISISDSSGDKSENRRDYEEVYEGDFWVVKLKADGTKEWDKTFGGNYFDAISSLQQTSDGGYILGGSSGSGKHKDKTEPNRGGSDGFGNQTTDYWVVKIDAKGNKVWDRTFGGDSWDGLRSIQQTSDGGYILGGYSRSGISGDKTEPNKGVLDEEGEFPADYWVVKLDASGKKLWDKTIGGSAGDVLNSMQQTSDGGFILGGLSISGKSGDKSEASRGSTDYWIVKLNANGTKAWDKTIGGNNDDDLESLQQTRDGGYILGGSSKSGVSGDKSEANKGEKDKYGQLTPDYWLVKLTTAGTKTWDKTIGGNQSDNFTSIRQTEDGNYIVAGFSNSGVSGDKSETSRGGDDYWVVKLKADGSKQWDKTTGGIGDDQLYDVQQTREGNYILGGISRSGGVSGDKTEPSKGSTDFWIVKLAEKATQTITFEPIPDKTFGAAPFALSAKASSGLPVTFSVVSGPATIKGNMLTLTGVGKVTVKATQAGNATYEAATATQTFLVLIPSTVQWDKTLGGSDHDALNALQQTKDGGYILGGISISDSSGDKSENRRDYSEVYEGDFWVVKLKADGTKEWDKTFGGNYYDHITAVQQTSDGGYILGGTSGSGKHKDKSEPNRGGFNDFGEATSDYWVVKIDAKGNKVWDKTLGGDSWEGLGSIQQTSDGGYILGGYSSSGISGDKTEPNKGVPNKDGDPTADYWVVKLDASGKKLWDKTFGGNAVDDLNSIQQTNDGGYILGGRSSSGIGGDKSEANKGQVDEYGYPTSDYWIVKLNVNGNKVWDKTFGGNNDDALQSIRQTSDSGYILGGNSDSDISGDKSQANKGELDKYGRLTPDYWIVKLTAEGTKAWDKTIGGNKFDGFTSLQQTEDGGYIVAGFSNSDLSGDKSEASKGGDDYWVVKLKTDGSKAWDKTIGSIADDQLYDVLQTREGSYILGGISRSGGVSGDKSEPDKGGGDFWVVNLQVDETPEANAWNMRYGGAGTDNFTVAIKTADGGYLSGGYTNSGVSGDKSQSSRGQNDYWIVKSDKNGQKLWDKRYGGSDNDFLNRVIQTQDGGYLLAGSSLSGVSGDKSQASRGDRDYWVVKVDKLGNKQWDKRFGGNGSDELEKVIQLTSGEYVLGGTSNSGASGDKSQENQGGKDYWLVKISATGTKLWDKRYGGNGNDLLGSFTQTKEGGFILGGTSLSGDNGDKSQVSRGNSDYWLVKTDKDGQKIWDKTFGGSGKDEAYSLVRNGNHYYLSGSSSSASNGEKSQDSQGGKDYWVVKVAADGTQLWDKRFGGNQDDELRASTFTRQGQLVLAGLSYSGASGDKTQASQGKSDYWLVQLDQEGNKVSDQRFGGSGTEELRTVFSTQDGGLLLGGRSDSGVSGDRTQPSQGDNDYWLVKLAPIASSLVAAREATPLEAANPVEAGNLQAYPNPFTDRARVRFTLPQTQPATVKVYDSQGREITTLFQGEVQANQTYEVEWQAGSQAAGMYLLQLQTATLRQQQKVLLSK